MRNRLKIGSAIALSLLMVAYYFSLTAKLFKDPYSKVLLSNNGALLTASIAADGQWRFPAVDTLPAKYVQALLAYEDKRFFDHFGIDFLALSRATQQNIQAGHIVSGGSTISMQVIRMARKGKDRSFFQKMIELILATRLEFRYSKEEILALYASHAPFGGNVVGLDAASWRYFGRGMQDVSWGEAALLAVLPNAPSLLHPGKNSQTLKKKRDVLLDRLKVNGIIDEITCTLAKNEPIPDRPQALPRHARHVLLQLDKSSAERSKLTTTISFALQERVEQLLEQHQTNLSPNKINNAAAIVIHNQSGKVLAYAGNINAPGQHQSEVDIIQSPRSTGSILKPFLYAAALDEGKILPKTLLPDVPTYINGFSPKNFSKDYDGAVPADKALIRSLNIPAVHLLKEYRYEKFHTLLKGMGMSTLNQSPDHYGLSLILGGAEGKLWDVASMYASMARVLGNYFTRPGARKYSTNDWRPATIFPKSDTNANQVLQSVQWLSAAAIYQTFETLTEVYRPGEETGWRYFSNSKKIAWKTGTSYGFRDGWAVGVTPEFTVGVWVGNADGEGRPGLTGTDAAAPLLFSIYGLLPSTTWFVKPMLEMQLTPTCSLSGFKAGPHCSSIDSLYAVKSTQSPSVCPFHQLIHLSADRKYRVNSRCASVNEMEHEDWFVLPAVQEYYFRAKNLSYKSLPPPMPGCVEPQAAMDLVYPKANAKVFIPRMLDGQQGQIVIELAHNQHNMTVYWHLDGQFLGSTRGSHQMAIRPERGRHILTLVDSDGYSIARSFEVISKM